MNLLLDTHTALWWWEDSPELSEAARRALSDPALIVYFSSISGYEIFQKVRSGKLELPAPLLDDLPGQVRCERWEVLPLGLADSVRAARIDHPHRDPFDRILAAQAEFHGLAVVTSDWFFSEAGFRTLW